MTRSQGACGIKSHMFLCIFSLLTMLLFFVVDYYATNLTQFDENEVKARNKAMLSKEGHIAKESLVIAGRNSDFFGDNGDFWVGEIVSLDDDNAETLAQHSPINIEDKNVTYRGPILPELKITYDQSTIRVRISNNGDDVFADLDCQLTSNTISQGPLLSSYAPSKLLFHWPSEHTIRNFRFAGELQLLHFDKANYQTLQAASAQPDGLAVLAVFLKLGQPNRELQMMLDHFDYIRIPGEDIVLPYPLDIAKLLPSDLDRYWTYKGSLTTSTKLLPKLVHSVRWIIFANPIDISQEQLKQMQQLYRFLPNDENKNQNVLMSENFHSVRQLTSSHVVHASWPQL